MQDQKLNILVVGSGGREHALVRSISSSDLVDNLYCAPGNAGIAQHAKIVDLNPSRKNDVLEFCRASTIDLVVVGPEGPLVDGLVDVLEKAQINVFGPSAAAAEIEGSKTFMKMVCKEANIPTAAYASFNSLQSAKTCIAERGAPIVVKADGLAAGKGVTVAKTIGEANEALEDIFKKPNSSVVIEDCLFGEEVSVFAICDGERAIAFGSAQDYKRIGENDQGPNTGGMGAYSPVTKFGEEIEALVIKDFVQPTLDVLKKRGTPFKGVLFAGLIMTSNGPKLLEFNARFGDPETQVILPRLKSDIVPLLLAAAKGDVSGISLDWSSDTVVTVVMASGGYPGAYETGHTISGLDDAGSVDGAFVYHAGTRAEEGDIKTNGGRVLNVTGSAERKFDAKHCAYEAVRKINWPDAQYRKDIAR